MFVTIGHKGVKEVRKPNLNQNGKFGEYVIPRKFIIWSLGEE